MSIKDQLLQDMKSAMKAKDTDTLGVIRYLRSQIKNYEIDHGEQNDQGVISLIAKEIKKIKDAITEFQKGDRQDLVSQEETKVKILEKYMPAQADQEEINNTIEKIISASDDKNMGNIIKQTMTKLTGRADGKTVADLVRQKLNS